jgi:hypothetical protein
MAFLRYISVISFAGALAGVGSYGCTVTTSSTTDAGKTDAAVKADTGTTADTGTKPEAATRDICEPDVTGFAPTTVKKARKQSACTNAQLKTFVDAGFNNNSTVDFQTWAADAANKACVQCTLGDIADADWAPYLFDGETSRGLNFGGCLELRGAAAACPQAIDETFACLDYACQACQDAIPDDAGKTDPSRKAHTACREKAGESSSACAKYAASETTNKCIVNFTADGGVAKGPDGGDEYIKSYEECLIGLPEENDGVPSEEADFYQFAERFFGVFCGTGS